MPHDAELDAMLEALVLQAIHMPVRDALRVCRRLRDTADDIVQIIAAAQMPAPPVPAEVIPIRPGAQIQYVDIKTAANMLGMGKTSLYARLEEAPYKAMLVDNGLHKRLFRLDALEAFIRQRTG